MIENYDYQKSRSLYHELLHCRPPRVRSGAARLEPVLPLPAEDMKIRLPIITISWTTPRSLKSGLVLPTQIFGLFGPPKKRVNFDKFNQRQKCVF